MAEVDKKLSQMNQAEGTRSGNDLEYIAVVDQESATGFSSRKITAQNKAQAYLNTFLFPLLLNTTSKSIIGAINELAQSSSSVLVGTAAPTSAQGQNGNLYVQYTAGTGGASDVVDAMFVKLDGAWCEISTGGGTAGTVLTDTLEAGETSLSFTDVSITAGAIIDIYTSVFGLAPTAVTVSSGTMTLTFASQGSDVDVKVVIT